MLSNLQELLTKLITDSGFENDDKLLGKCRLLPKKLRIDPKKGTANGHVHFSSPARAFKHLELTHDLVPEYRIMGDFPVESHIISALWINMVGHKFDALLDDTAYGSRLRRVRNDEVLDKSAPKSFHISAVGSFKPYFQPYQQWRNDGLKTIRNELEQERQVVAVSLDLRSYYHLIDPTFLLSTTFLKEIGVDESTPTFSAEESVFTQQLVNLLTKWSAKAADFAETFQSGAKVSGGLVIGLTASRIIANVLLHKWDRLIREKLTPVHYGRYVDDMFIVLRDPGTVYDTHSLMIFLQNRLGKETIKPIGPKKNALWVIQLGEHYQKNSRIELQSEKQKLFLLEGQAGFDLLDSIEKEINELSSEHRLMPAPDLLEHSTAARVLSAAGKAGEQADTLRRADGLTIRRLSWSLQLRHVETLAHDLPANEWKKQRDEFYQFAQNHVLRPDNIFAHYQYLPRLLGFAIGQHEWTEAERIVRSSFDAIDKLEAASQKLISINGVDVKNSTESLTHIKASLTWAFIDAAARYYPVELLFSKKPSAKVQRLAKLFLKQLLANWAGFGDIWDFTFNLEEFYNKAPLLALADLARTPYKRLVVTAQESRENTLSNNLRELRLWKAYQRTGLLECGDLLEFLRSSQLKRLSKSKDKALQFEALTPFIFPTRPYSPSEIAECVPACVGLDVLSTLSPQSVWARYVRVLRGVWVKPGLLVEEGFGKQVAPYKQERLRIDIGTQKSKSVLVGITNIAIDNATWAATACARPSLTLERYTRISELVNQAIKLKPRPSYLLFPELSIPNEWVESIANRLLGAGISLIAGTEYRHYLNDRIHSDAFLALADDRLGYSSSVRIRQPKLEPAVGEDKELTTKFGKRWYSFDKAMKPVYNHNGFHFGIMVCSELQNSQARVGFQGEVDSLMVLSWNQDLETFSSLIESAALDIHAYTILVNNRTYGDSRVRAPSKESFKRDLARLRGGKNDFCVTVELDLEKLRAFQSRAKRWPEEGDPFKPVPEGFKMAPSRKHTPPK